MSLPAPDRDPIEIRPLRTGREYADCLRLQRSTWGPEFGEAVPPAILKIGQRIGGVTAGAFDVEGRMLGFVFGLTGVEDGRPVHWSDMLAVLPEARDRGIGRRLKEFQRDHLRELGVELVYWTFDPLVARNAHLNLARLGVEVVEYVVDMYGADSDSELHRGLGTDRFVVAWRIGGAGVRSSAGGVGGAGDAGDAGDARNADTAAAQAIGEARDAGDIDDAARAGEGGIRPVPLLTSKGERPQLDRAVLERAPTILSVEIPADIGVVQARSEALATEWRLRTRAAFLDAAASGYRISGFLRPDSDCSGRYLLALPG